MHAEESLAKAITELLPKIRELNPDAKESLLADLAEVFLSELCQQLLRARNELDHFPDDEDRETLMLMFIEHGIDTKTAEDLYLALITLNIEVPDSDETPQQ